VLSFIKAWQQITFWLELAERVSFWDEMFWAVYRAW